MWICSQCGGSGSPIGHVCPSKPSSLLTPYELGVLLRQRNDGLQMEPTTARDKLYGLGLIVAGSSLVLTARGQAYVDSLLRVPLPEAVWVTRWPQP